MIVHIFRGTGRVFGFTGDKHGTNLHARFAPWVPFKAITMHVDEPQAGVEVNACLSDIREYGYHLTDAHERITHLVVEGDYHAKTEVSMYKNGSNVRTG